VISSMKIMIRKCSISRNAVRDVISLIRVMVSTGRHLKAMRRRAAAAGL
jgi:hypothetical protein